MICCWSICLRFLEDPISLSSPWDKINQLEHLASVKMGSIRSPGNRWTQPLTSRIWAALFLETGHFLHQVKQKKPPNSPKVLVSIGTQTCHRFTWISWGHLVLSCWALFLAPQHDCKLDQYLDPSVPHPAAHLAVKYHLAAIFVARYFCGSPDGLENLGVIMQTNKSTYATLSTKDSN